jgi:hypothetical protein
MSLARGAGATLLAFIVAMSAAGQDPSGQAAPILRAGAVVEAARELDCRFLSLEGEAIGEFLERGDQGWLNLLDQGTAIGVWAERAALPAGIDYGSYRRRGSLLRVRGILHRACPEHGGDLDLHALEIELIAPGAATPHPVARSRLVLAAILLLAAALSGLLWLRTEAAARGLGREARPSPRPGSARRPPR